MGQNVGISKAQPKKPTTPPPTPTIIQQPPNTTPQPTVAVIIPCHNYGRYLRECIESVLNQTQPADEVVVVLDNCDDNSAEVAARYPVEVITVRCCDPFLSRRAGFKYTNSEIVCFLDADDQLSLDYLRLGTPLFSDIKVGIVTPWLQIIGDTSIHHLDKSDLSLDIEVVNTVTSAALVRRAAIDRSAIVDSYELSQCYHEDWYFWRAIVRNGWTIAQNEARHIYRRHANNRSLMTAGGEGQWSGGFAKEVNYLPPTKTRVAMLSQSGCTGGLVMNTLHKMREAQLLDWVAFILTDGAASDQQGVDDLNKHTTVYGGIPHPTINADNGIKRVNVGELIQDIAKECDVFYIWGTTNTALLTPYLNTHKIITGVHGQGDWSRSGVVKHAPIADVVYCVSQSTKDIVPSEYKHKTVVIHNGVDLRSLVPNIAKDTIRSNLGLKPDDITVGYCGRLGYEKRPLTALRAVEVLPQQYKAVFITPHAKYGSPHGDSMRDEIIKSDRAILCIGDNNMGDLYQTLDCLVISSIEEGGPLVLLEAFACGIPVVSTVVGLVPELERKYGKLTIPIAKDATPQQVANAIQDAIHPLNKPTIHRARELVINQFNSIRLCRDFEKMVTSK
jgi:glycosyltransferase involved in cell wall biosynthesis